jgi:hypothetical protein
VSPRKRIENDGNQGVVLFHTTHAVFQLEKALAEHGVPTKLIPTPRHLSSDCGAALRFPLPSRSAVEEAIAAHAIEIAGIHEI